MKLSHSQRKKINRKKQIEKDSNIKRGKNSLVAGWKVKDHREPIVFKSMDGGKYYRDVPIEEIDDVARQLRTTRESLIRDIMKKTTN